MNLGPTRRLRGLLCGILAVASIQSIAVAMPQSPEDHALDAGWTTENEVTIGKHYATQLQDTQLLVQDPATNKFVTALGGRLARECNLPFTITVKIVEANNIDAIALPGGFLYLTSELIRAAGDEAELAGAMAHQLAHICLHHFARGTTQEDYRRLSAPRILQFGALGSGVIVGPGAMVSVSLPFTQSFPPNFEFEAEDLAFRCLDKAGYDPHGLIAYRARIEALERESPGLIALTFASHLHVAHRARKANVHGKSLQRGDQYIVNTSEFDAVKAYLIRRISGEPRLFSILLTTSHAAVKTGSRVELEMTLTNISNRSVSFYADGLFPYEIDVRDSAGMMAPDTEAGLRLKEKQRNGVVTDGSGFYSVKPGEKIVSKCLLNDYYDTSKPGEYFIQVEHRRTVDSHAIIRSNTLKMTTLTTTGAGRR